MSGPDDSFDFGSDIDDADFLAVATQVEASIAPAPQLPAPKKSHIPPPRPTPPLLDDDDDDGDIVIDSDGDGDVAITLARQPPPAAPRGNLRQTTLFGSQIEDEDSSQSVRRNWPPVNRNEEPTHHSIDREAAETWIYPSNVSFRDYQFNIVKRALFSNILVALPTGLGKTFIAATVMLNWFRWAPNSQICFVAPTKPLVNQQMEACYHTVGIPRSQTAELTGGVTKPIRQEYWEERRVFFLTPQTLQNDIKTGLCDPKRIALLVVDEAHRSTGKYAYGEVVKLIRRENQSFRIMALTATPGSSVESVQEVIDALGIARVEIRTDESLDIRSFIKKRHLEIETFDMSPEQEELQELYCKCLEPLLKKLTGQKAYYNSNPQTITPFSLLQARKSWTAKQKAQGTDKGGNYFMLQKTFTILQSLALPMRLLQTHGVRVFYNKLTSIRDGKDTDDKESQAQQAMKRDRGFFELVDRAAAMVDDPNFSGHPKMDYMITSILRHFTEAEDEETKRETRIIVFTSFRDSAEEIVKTLQRQQPMIRPHVFVGQQVGASGSAGMTQKEQLEAIKRFQDGTYNTLVATSIGEEGLDIGEVDMIVCYDTSGSGIRLIQRMGRTGRKRNGSVLLLLSKGTEEAGYHRAVDEQKVMQKKIAAGTDFTFPYQLSPRILPPELIPEPDQKYVEIPIENTQPEPERKRPRAKKKAPPKKFFMPKGVQTGFTTARRLGKDSADELADDSPPPSSPEPAAEEDELVPIIPDDSEVGLLSLDQEKDLERRYRRYARDTDGALADRDLFISTVASSHPEAQRVLQPAHHLKHGRRSRRLVRLVNRMRDFNEEHAEEYRQLFDPALLKAPPKTKPFKPVQPKKKAVAAATPLSTAAGNISDGSGSSGGSKLKVVLRPPRKRAPGVENIRTIELSDDDDELEMKPVEPSRKRFRTGSSEDEVTPSAGVGSGSDDSLPDEMELLKPKRRLQRLVRRG